MIGPAHALWFALAAASPEWAALSPAARDAAVAEARRLPMPERLVALSAGFVGTPYQASPLGEGQGKDADPRIRFDAVDCLTFVETTLAMALAKSPADVEPLLQRVRYAKEQTYDDRNHLMEAQWLPNNVVKGFLRDRTRELGGAAVVLTEKTLTAKSWAGTAGLALELPEARHLAGTFPFPIVPIGQALEAARKAPTGTLVVVVRADRPQLVTRVSHLGFLVQGKRPLLRHASRTFGRVTDEDLEAFLSRNLGYAKWTVSGLAFYEAKAPAE